MTGIVTFRNMGRLGNFLFQAATAYAYALDHVMEFTVPFATANKKWDPIYFPHLIKPLPATKIIRLMEDSHSFQEIPFQEGWRTMIICLEGYFQTEKYFLHHRSAILKAFNLPWEPHNNVSIHVRRGDYLQYPEKHPVVQPEYYIDCIGRFAREGFRDFHIFSDDLPWCVQFFESINMLFKGVTFHYSTGKNELEDLVAISNCAAGHINSSSTFSWWGAWLNQNPNKTIFTPKLWFVEGHGGLSTKDIIPKTWIKL